MTYDKLIKLVKDCCSNNHINFNLFYVASICNGNGIIYDFRNKKEEITQKYVLRYFKNFDAVVIWNRWEHKKSKKLTLDKKDFMHALESFTNIGTKGVEFKNWKTTKVYVAQLDEIEKIIKMCK